MVNLIKFLSVLHCFCVTHQVFCQTFIFFIFLWIPYFFLWNLRPLPLSLWLRMTYILHPPYFGNPCLSLPHTYIVKLWVFSPVDVSHVSLILRAARRILRSRGNFFLPNNGKIHFAKDSTEGGILFPHFHYISFFPTSSFFRNIYFTTLAVTSTLSTESIFFLIFKSSAFIHYMSS